MSQCDERDGIVQKEKKKGLSLLSLGSSLAVLICDQGFSGLIDSSGFLGENDDAVLCWLDADGLGGGKRKEVLDGGMCFLCN